MFPKNTRSIRINVEPLELLTKEEEFRVDQYNKHRNDAISSKVDALLEEYKLTSDECKSIQLRNKSKIQQIIKRRLRLEFLIDQIFGSEIGTPFRTLVRARYPLWQDKQIDKLDNTNVQPEGKYDGYPEGECVDNQQEVNAGSVLNFLIAGYFNEYFISAQAMEFSSEDLLAFGRVQLSFTDNEVVTLQTIGGEFIDEPASVNNFNKYELILLVRRRSYLLELLPVNNDNTNIKNQFLNDCANSRVLGIFKSVVQTLVYD